MCIGTLKGVISNRGTSNSEPPNSEPPNSWNLNGESPNSGTGLSAYASDSGVSSACLPKAPMARRSRSVTA